MTPKKEELRDDILALQRKVKERESDISALTMGSKLLDLKVSELEKTISEINTEKLKAERQSENYLSHMRNVETSYRTLTEEVVELRNENAAQAQEIRKLKKL
ncbi:uncharacterized protein LOC110839468 [Zootermopsis nevadensis]|uniref:uncharacterized protein LOC110839468 n=1 Tax=Zootermopsis nevadensis TaxID=136037 RepID=UPI000B8E9A47|nr:uncharacterized protein LOC110839468 [Zootermopsis nevadensis]